MLNTSGQLFGRKKQLDYLCNVVNQSKKSVTCIVGEKGIGKSALLGKLYNELEKRDTDFLLGFYDKDSSLWGESQSPNHPFVTILVNLIEWAKNRENMDFKKRAEYTFVERVKNVKKFAPDLFSAFVGDIASKVGFEKL